MGTSVELGHILWLRNILHILGHIRKAWTHPFTRETRYCKYSETKDSSLYTHRYTPLVQPNRGMFLYCQTSIPATQNVQASFDSLTSQHFAAFFRKSLSTYGVDEADARANKEDMDNPDNAISSPSHPAKRKKMRTISTSTTSKLSVHRQKLEGGSELETRTRTMQTTIKRVRVDILDVA